MAFPLGTLWAVSSLASWGQGAQKPPKLVLAKAVATTTDMSGVSVVVQQKRIHLVSIHEVVGSIPGLTQ